MPRGTSQHATTALALAGAVAVFAAGCGGSAAVAPPDGDAGSAQTDAGDAGDGPVDAPADAPVELPPPPLPYPRPSYQHLAETGLYADFAGKQLAPELIAFEPTHKLWSDGATKRRWVRLPPGTKIDTSDMDHWVFPVGAQLFKEFSLNGVLLETRLVERYGDGPEDYWMGAFVWNEGATDAVLSTEGAMDVVGTMHDVPSQKDCGLCHRGDVGRVLGLSAIQMSRTDHPPAMRELASMGLLSAPPADLGGFPAPGDATTAAALGYLHANCGHCHNKNGTAWPDTQMVLRLTTADRDPATSGVYASIVGKDVNYWRGGPITKRVLPGTPDMSAVFVRMSARGTKDQMPPLATEIVDPAGIELIRAWILGLPSP
jgi:hypothetical protein